VTIWILVTKLIMQSVLPEGNNYHAYYDATFSYRIGTGVFIYGLIILTYYLFTSLTNLSEKNAKEARLESLVKETELKLLRSQINPHFLFNSLNSISSLTVTDPEKARDMIVKLSDFMRYSLSSRNDHLISLQNEMESLRIYLEIEKVRFRERLIIEEQVENECLDAMLPGLLLQPLYENAVKHGVYESNKTVIIKTTAVKNGEHVIITISNTIDQEAIVTRKGAGIGLMNVRSRLELFFGKDAELNISRSENEFTVTVKFPYRNS